MLPQKKYLKQKKPHDILTLIVAICHPLKFTFKKVQGYPTRQYEKQG
jgi:hypothetical protein